MLTLRSRLGYSTGEYKGFSAIDDLGSELDLSYVRKYGKHYSAGMKYAAYSAGDVGAGKVYTDKLWVWLGLKF